MSSLKFAYIFNKEKSERSEKVRERLDSMGIRCFYNPGLDEVDQTFNQSKRLAIIFLGKKLDMELLGELKKYNEKLLRILFEKIELDKLNRAAKEKLGDCRVEVIPDFDLVMKRVDDFFQNKEVAQKNETDDIGEIEFNVFDEE